LGWAGVEAFTDLRQGLVWEVVGEDGQECIAQECQIGQEVWVATARAVFSHERITSPVIADFHAAPVSANQLEPMAGTVLIGRRTGEVIAGFGGGQPGIFDSALTAQDDQGSGKGEVGRQGFDGERVEAAGFDPPVSGLGVGKKGVDYFVPNGFGLYDMAGNVDEWCWDLYGTPLGQPTTTNPTGPAAGSFRMLRGGLSFGSASSSRCSNRTYYTIPSWADFDGVRCVRGS
jgi:hypothetical protein